MALLPDALQQYRTQNHTTSWIGYKLHIDAADGGIPVSCILTSASLHDSQVAIPLATMSAERVTNLYDLMDSAYDAPEIGWHSYLLGHVPIIDINPRDRGLQRGLGAGGQGAAPYRPQPPGGRPLQRTLERRAHQWRAEGQLRWTPCPRARPCQSLLPRDVRHPGADGRPIGAPSDLNLTFGSVPVMPEYASLDGGTVSRARTAAPGHECDRNGPRSRQIGSPTVAMRHVEPSIRPIVRVTFDQPLPSYRTPGMNAPCPRVLQVAHISVAMLAMRVKAESQSVGGITGIRTACFAASAWPDQWADERSRRERK